MMIRTSLTPVSAVKWLRAAVWTSDQAALLLSGVCPDAYKELRERRDACYAEGGEHNKAPWTEMDAALHKINEEAREVKRCLTSLGFEANATPANWMQRIRSAGLPLPEILVFSKCVSEEPKPSEQTSPPSAEELENALDKDRVLEIFGTLTPVNDRNASIYKNLKKALGSSLSWIKRARLEKGRRGGRSALWQPVKLARAFHQKYGISKHELDMKFANEPLLRFWLAEWQTAARDLPEVDKDYRVKNGVMPSLSHE